MASGETSSAAGPDAARSAGGRTPRAARLASLDQFRGYTVLGMFLVNFIGFFAVTPAIFKHHNTYCSYADTVMPQFFFAVGFAYRLTLLRRLKTQEPRSVYNHFCRRNLGLVMLGAFLYVGLAAVDAWTSPNPPKASTFVGVALRTELFQALVHIGVTAFWIMPVIAAGPAVRIAFAVGSAALQVVLSQVFYYQWVMTAPGIDGGPLGFLTWSVPMLAGSLAYDLVVSHDPGARVRRLLAWGAALAILGYALSCLNRVTPPNQPTTGSLAEILIEPPFVPPTMEVNYWNMNQQAGSISYLTFGAGFSMVLLGLFVWACDLGGLQIGVFRTFGTNALTAYVIHMLVDRALKSFTPQDCSPLGVVSYLALFLMICYFSVRLLEKRGVYLRM
jgi:predicted acyltransferase